MKRGGALLIASGPSFATDNSIYFTSLMDVIPAAPSGDDVIRQEFTPEISDLGQHHPVTRSLVWSGGNQAGDDKRWGPWLRQVSLRRDSGDILMEGINDDPLLILDRVEDGRVAQIASDHIWLWSRGYQGGGPHSELLRRIVHWLMKEPQLDERALTITASGNDILIKSLDLEGQNQDITMTKPDGTTEIVTLEPREDFVFQKRVIADQLGIYSFEDGYGQRRFITIGQLNPPELTSVITSQEKMLPLLKESRGASLWLEDSVNPSIRFLSRNRSTFAGQNWIGLRQNNEYLVDGVIERTLLPSWVSVLLLISLATLTWWLEGRRT